MSPPRKSKPITEAESQRLIASAAVRHHMTEGEIRAALAIVYRDPDAVTVTYRSVLRKICRMADCMFTRKRNWADLRLYLTGSRLKRLDYLRGLLG